MKPSPLVVHVPLKPGKDAFNAKALTRAIADCRSRKMVPVLVPEIDGSGTTALLKQYQRMPKSYHSPGNHVLITCGSVDTSKCRYVADGRKPIRFNDEHPTWIFEGPEVIADVATRTGCGLFEPTGFKYPVHFRGLREVSYASDFGHHPKAILLEEDRALGRRIASQVGRYSVPRTVSVRTPQDIHPAVIEFANAKVDHVAIKRAKGQFVQKASRHNLAATLNELLPGGALTVEEWIVGEEFDVSFFVQGRNVRPMLFVTETNKLLPNGTGGKLGTAWSKHVIVENSNHKWLRYATEGMQRIADHMADKKTPLVGWVDASFIEPSKVDVVGGVCVPRHIEWMIRGGVSNFITIAHQMKMGFLELFTDITAAQLATPSGIHANALWRDPVSYGVEVYTLPFNISHVQPTTVLNKFESGGPALTFDPLDQAAVFYDYATSRVPIFGTDSNQRVGVFSIRGTAIPHHVPHHIFQHQIHTFVEGIPNGAYRYME